VLLDGSPDLVRVRTGYLTDADITTMAAEYATPHREDGWVAGVPEPRTAEVLDTEWLPSLRTTAPAMGRDDD